jgi:cysteine-rich repeat protein
MATAPTTVTGTDTTDASGTDGTSTTEGSDSTDSTADEGGSEETGQPPPACGDGMVDAGEACDDGNLIPDDGCTHLCALPVCGDGVVSAGEQCDAGADNGPGKPCLASCKSNVCGDGDKGPGEGCDDGNVMDGDMCTAQCALATCGDGKLNVGEACDDGNDINEDACTNACTKASCGDQFIQLPEQCDLGKLNSDAGECTTDCKDAFCGDGKTYAGLEECDAGVNNGPGKACLGSCTINVCGDGDKGPGEECDFGGGNGDNKACHLNCKLDVCGDGKVGPNETCDDKNLINDDGCSNFCVKQLKCEGKLYQCGNGIDDDMDGKIDLKDPECTSPCDDSEKSFQTNLPGQNLDCRSDCYWDSNSGGGNDQCEWNLKCDPKNSGASVGCAYDPNLKMCAAKLPPACLNFCVPLIPNGCDCFGCCNIANKFYYLNSGPNCSINNLAACNTCTFFPQCANTCETENCELCFGQTIEDLPAECNEMPSCMNGVSCVSEADCAGGEFCQTGCCAKIVPQ